MKILDINDNELINPDLTLGYLKEDTIFKQHHEAVNPVAEQWHYEVIAEYKNGGKDVKKIIDIPYTPGQEAWDEYENIYRYIETEEEIIPAGPSELEILKEKVNQLEQLLARFTNLVGINATIEEV